MGKRILFHGTSIENVESIKKTGLKSKWEGVYLTDSPQSAARWVGLRLAAMGESELAIICVSVDEDQLVPGCDHSPLMIKLFGVGESIVHPDPIPPDRVLDVLYYELNREPE